MHSAEYRMPTRTTINSSGVKNKNGQQQRTEVHRSVRGRHSPVSANKQTIDSRQNRHHDSGCTRNSTIQPRLHQAQAPHTASLVALLHYCSSRTASSNGMLPPVDWALLKDPNSCSKSCFEWEAAAVSLAAAMGGASIGAAKGGSNPGRLSWKGGSDSAAG